jgi:L-ascorbate metabolism protein UlaG (beta-lactamase superfamily)
MQWTRDALGGGARGLVVRWLGTAGFELRCEGHTLLIDPYLTRASLRQCVLSRLVPDEALLARHCPRADAIILGHTHFDHALDVPSIARATGAQVFGSRSAAELCKSHGVDPTKIDVVERPAGSEPVERGVGPFRLYFYPSAHARLLLGRVPFAGEIADCEDVPLRAHEYRCGAVFGVEIRVGGKTLFHLGSAEILDATLPRLEADLVLMCVAGWTTSRQFPERAMRALSPSAVLLSHWDNFLSPLSRGAKALPALKLEAFVDRLSRTARDVNIGTLPLLGEVVV